NCLVRAFALAARGGGHQLAPRHLLLRVGPQVLMAPGPQPRRSLLRAYARRSGSRLSRALALAFALARAASARRTRRWSPACAASSITARGAHVLQGAGAPPPALAAPRIRASQRLKAVTRSRSRVRARSGRRRSPHQAVVTSLRRVIYYCAWGPRPSGRRGPTPGARCS